MRSLRQTRPVFIVFLYVCACLQFVRFYVRSSDFYLNLPAYLAGHERLPFQERILPVILMREIFHSHFMMNVLVHDQGVAARERAPFYLLSVIGTFGAAFFTQLLYRSVSQKRTLPFLVLPLLLFCMLWTYVVHNEANFSYPYDLLSLAFFTAGLYFIHERRYVPLLLVILIGTFNRETTLFLIGIYAIDCASSGVDETLSGPALAGLTRLKSLSIRKVPWLRVALLCGIWALVKGFLAYKFRHNDNSENFTRFVYNAERLKLRLVPALLNICGYLLPVMLLYWRRIRPYRFGNYILILAIWVPLMIYTGVLLETRIYGELCSWTAVAMTLLAEEEAGEAATRVSPRISTTRSAEAV
ncbi:hypothetical protein [Terriglobus sp.]|uniref:hypothetical protein n=1 Tax=Terriglobus sp. TaxID=1889013 RepID=UPI003B00878A